jgi:hypothetical protein
MPLTFDFKGARYDNARRAVVFDANDGGTRIGCLVTADALNDRGSTWLEGDALLVVLMHYSEEIALLINAAYEIGAGGDDGEIWLTTREFYR